jgi:tetratricopeptide (TPR) repeat protein
MNADLVGRFNPILQKRRAMALGLWGEAGVGKSYQVKELLQSLPCRSASLHATTPLSSLTTTLPQPKKLATWAERTLERVAKNEAVETAGVLDALGATLSGLAPFVLHLEDIHEADTERSAFIQDLAKIVSRIKGVGLVVTSRQQPLDPFTALKLEPLSQLESDALLETELKNSLPKDALTWIYDKAAGNPLYTLEYLRFLTRQGFLWNDGKSWHWRKPQDNIMPITVEALIEQLLDRAKTQPLQGYVLETKAFLPLNTSDEMWAKVARVEQQELQTVKAELVQQGIFRENNFGHPLFREVTLKTMGAERRQNLARRAINVFEYEPTQAALFIDDARLEPSQSLALLIKAAEHVKERNEVESGRFLAKAVVYATGEEKAQLALRAAQALRLLDQLESMRLARLVLALQPENQAAIYHVAELLALEKRPMSQVDEMLARLPEAERKGIPFVANLIRLRAVAEDNQGVVELWQRHPEVATVDAGTALQLAWALAALSQYDKARAVATQGLALPNLTANQQSRLITVFGIICGDLGDYTNAETYLAEAVAFARVAGRPRNLASALANHAHVLQSLGRYQEMLAQYEEAKQLASQVGDAHVVGILQVSIAEQLLEFGAYEQAEKVLLEGWDFLKNTSSFALVNCEAVLSRLYSEGNYPHGTILAVKHAQNALRVAQLSQNQNPKAVTVSLLHLAKSDIRQGNFSKAKERAEEALQLGKEKGLAEDTCMAQMILALALEGLGQLEEAKVGLHEAKVACENTGLLPEAQKIGLELDRLNNDLESARKRMQWFEERGLWNGVNIAKRYFPELADTKESATPAESNIRLEVLGTLQARGDTQIPIRGRKRQELLALLLEARISGRSEVSRLSLLDTLYPDEDELKASSSLKVVVHNLRETLGESAIITTNNGYALGACNSDAELFLQTGDTTLWRGVYLEDLDLEDSTVRDSLYLSLFEKIKTLLETNPKEAARVAEMLVEAEPYNTDYLKPYLTALRSSKNHGKLTRHYQEARKRLLEVGERLPEAWQKFLS